MIPVLLPPVVEPLPMRIFCAWCGRIIQDGDPALEISHGIHPACAHLFEQEVA